MSQTWSLCRHSHDSSDLACHKLILDQLHRLLLQEWERGHQLQTDDLKEIPDNALSVDPASFKPQFSHFLQIPIHFSPTQRSHHSGKDPPRHIPLRCQFVAMESWSSTNQVQHFTIMSLPLHFTAARYFRVYPLSHRRKSPKVDIRWGSLPSKLLGIRNTSTWFSSILDPL